MYSKHALSLSTPSFLGDGSSVPEVPLPKDGEGISSWSSTLSSPDTTSTQFPPQHMSVDPEQDTTSSSSLHCNKAVVEEVLTTVAFPTAGYLCDTMGYLSDSKKKREDDAQAGPDA
jgi:hypothetical protein